MTRHIEMVVHTSYSASEIRDIAGREMESFVTAGSGGVKTVTPSVVCKVSGPR